MSRSRRWATTCSSGSSATGPSGERDSWPPTRQTQPVKERDSTQSSLNASRFNIPQTNEGLQTLNKVVKW